MTKIQQIKSEIAQARYFIRRKQAELKAAQRERAEALKNKPGTKAYKQEQERERARQAYRQQREAQARAEQEARARAQRAANAEGDAERKARMANLVSDAKARMMAAHPDHGGTCDAFRKAHEDWKRAERIFAYHYGKAAA